MRSLWNGLFAVVIALLVAGCGRLPILDDTVTGSVEREQESSFSSAKVYIFRGVGGRWASSEMDGLGEKIRQHGLETEVDSFGSWADSADAAIDRYNRSNRRSTFIAIGHSAGADAAIRFAERLRYAGVPVGLVVTFDPTRGARRIPGNVARFINIYESTNLIGGGDPSPASDFRSDFASVDFRDWSVLHVNVPKITGVEDLVAAKVVQAASLQVRYNPASVPIEYAIPRNEPVILWDSGAPIQSERGDTAATIAAKYAVPVWAIAQINGIDPGAPLPEGQRLVVPRHLDPGTGRTDGRLSPGDG